MFKLKLLFLLLSFLILSSHFVFAEVNANPQAVSNLDFKKLRETYKVDKYYWVIYDNVCPYCRNATEHIKALDWEKKIKFLSYRNPLTYKLFPNLTKDECEKDVHMVTPKGEVLAGYEVFRTIIDNLTATKLINPLLKNDYAETKLTEIYEKMVKERSCYYNKSDACPLKKHEQKGN